MATGVTHPHNSKNIFKVKQPALPFFLYIPHHPFARIMCSEMIAKLERALKLAERHSIKIVEEPSNYGIGNSYQGAAYHADSNLRNLKMRITPSNFSGPELFRRLNRKCFTKTDDTYKYEFCPFSNVTQHEQSLRWNPYSGVLGVYQEWEIINNTFVAMVMREGDKCGSQFRTVKITFPCGKENKIINVTEPSTCNYHMTFETPYVCHKHAMLVYPTLDTERQTEWGLLEGELARGEITQKGYDKYLRRIFAKAGYCLSEEKRKALSEQAVEKELKQEKEEIGQFDNLYKCTEEYQKLKKEVEGLRALVELNKADKHVDYREDHGMIGEDYIMGDMD